MKKILAIVLALVLLMSMMASVVTVAHAEFITEPETITVHLNHAFLPGQRDTYNVCDADGEVMYNLVHTIGTRGYEMYDANGKNCGSLYPNIAGAVRTYHLTVNNNKMDMRDVVGMTAHYELDNGWEFQMKEIDFNNIKSIFDIFNMATSSYEIVNEDEQIATVGLEFGTMTESYSIETAPENVQLASMVVMVHILVYEARENNARHTY